MQPQETPDVQYSRWNERNQDEVSVNTSNVEVSTWRRVHVLLCTGRIGIAMKVVAGLALFWIIFIIGYVTGYYVHKCKKA
ncbi:small integral membrane protein 1 [Dendropsophus ebraccatus]|uniref:small integral membrane protein 1 n=1 Tax=Dendropsophus ebraccatus TaxID=150705 RepID=UPI003831B266